MRFAVLLLLISFAAGPAAASRVSWVSPVIGDWNDPSRWSTGSVPSGADSVEIAVAGTYTVRCGQSTAVLAVEFGGSSGEQWLDLGVEFALTATFTANSFHVGPRGSLVLQGVALNANVVNEGMIYTAWEVNLSVIDNRPGASIKIGPFSLTRLFSMTNHGTLTLDPGSIVANDSYLRITGSLINAADGKLTTGYDFRTWPTFYVYGAVLNSGSITVTAGSTLQFRAGSVTNTGTVLVRGVLQVNGAGFVNHGALDVSQRIEVFGQGTFDWGLGSVAGAGLYQFDGARLTGGAVTFPMRAELHNTIVSLGTLEIPSGANLALQGGSAIRCPTEIAGTVTVQGPDSLSGATSILAGGRVTVGGVLHVIRPLVNRGFLEILAGGALDTNQPVTNQAGGSIDGGGTLDVSRSFLIEEGTLRPGSPIGRLTVRGHCRMQPSATLQIDLGGPAAGTQHDVLAVSDSASLDGALHASFSFPAAVGDRFTVLTSRLHSGIFDEVTWQGLGIGMALRADYVPAPDTQRVVLEVVDQETDVLLALFEASEVSGGVELRWRLRDETHRAMVLERSENGSGVWIMVRSIDWTGRETSMLDADAQPGKSYVYRLRTIGEEDGILGMVEIVTGPRIAITEVESVHPNPARDHARIAFTLAKLTPVRISVLDVAGRVMEVLMDDVLTAGRYDVDWNATTARRKASSGVYFVKMETSDGVSTRPVILDR